MLKFCLSRQWNVPPNIVGQGFAVEDELTELFHAVPRSFELVANLDLVPSGSRREILIEIKILLWVMVAVGGALIVL